MSNVYSIYDIPQTFNVYNDLVMIKDIHNCDGHGNYNREYVPIFYKCSPDIFQIMLYTIPPNEVINYRHNEYQNYNILQLMNAGGCEDECYAILRNYIPRSHYNILVDEC